jgi:hypothetical protein
MKYLVTNLADLIEKPDFNGELLFFNPWGFSKKGIVEQVSAVTAGISKEFSGEIYYYVAPLFYGKRGRIGLDYLRREFTRALIIEINHSEDFRLFSN